MKITFLGGAESIGASSAFVEIGERRWVIDCGVRVKGSGAERLPDLARLEDLGPPSAVLVTHAHLDHIGALPVLHQRFPLVPIYATAPTIDLTRVQLLDSLKIMEEQASVEGELPLYSAAAVESLLARMAPVTPLRPFAPEAGGPEVTFHPAGHILGACALSVAAREGTLFWSGDVSFDSQRTIPGMRPPRLRADVAVLESTYGSRLHAQRSLEEERLAETVAGVVAAGGKVLIPAFALGRAQEVLLVLLGAQLRKTVPEFPVYADGMVRRVCDVYASHPRYLHPALRRRVEKRGDPFFAVLESVRPVKSAAERAAVLSGPPCAIVSSSGMLSGGPSVYYADALLDDPRALIAVTGYQDEEAPGRQLLDTAAGRSETVTLNGRERRPQCRIASYALSGHASGAQVASLAAGLRPADVLLVHGDSASRRELADLLVRERAGRVQLPEHGVVHSPLGRRARGSQRSIEADVARRLKVAGLGGRGAAAPSTEDLARMASHLREHYPPAASFSAIELFYLWHGRAPEDEGEAERFEDAVRACQQFSSHPTRLFQFQAAEPPAEAATGGAEALESLLGRIDAALPPDSGLLRKSYQPGARHLVLVFDFPARAAERLGRILDGVFDGSGWTYALHPHPNLARLDEVIRALVPDRGLVARNPSVRAGERAAAVFLARPLDAAESVEWDRAAALVRERTGFRVELCVQPSTPPPKETRDASGRLEINLVYSLVRGCFAARPHQPHRVGRKPGAPGQEDFVEVAFISPEVAARYREDLERLSLETGWRLEASRVPNQNAIAQAAREVLDGIAVRKGPSVRPAEGKVSVRVDGGLDPARCEELRRTFRERTGYELEVEGGAGPTCGGGGG